jgi:UMF1 family MFS transporter
MVAATEQRSTRRERWAWYLYDFGNSAYAAVVLLAVYSAYFKGGVVGDRVIQVGNAQLTGTGLWAWALFAAMLVVAVTAPILGTLADFSGSKKHFLLFYTAMACLFTASLFFVTEGRVVLGMVLFVVAELSYRSAQVFYNSLLPEIASPEEIGRVSGNGWAIGSAGGIICLLIVLVPITLTDKPNLEHINLLVVRLSLVFTAVFFAVSALPIFLWLPERAKGRALPAGENYVGLAFKRLWTTFRAVRRFREFMKFMLAFFVYNDGILMILDYGAILGAVLFGMNTQDLIIFMIIVQMASVAGAYLFGLIADDFGPKRSLIISLALTIVPVIWLFFSYSRLQFYFIGGIAGFALTGVQSLSRAAVGMFAPEGQSAEFYGFFALSGRSSSIIGPLVFGLLADRIRQWYISSRGLVGEVAKQAAEQDAHRIALFSIVAFLAVGMALLLLVNEKRGREAAKLGTHPPGE